MLLCLRRTTTTATFNLRLSLTSPFNPFSTLPLHSSPEPASPLTNPELKVLVLSQYAHGKFTNLLQNAVASPSFLLTACHNLATNSPSSLTLDSLSTLFFSLQEMAAQLATNRFPVESCCVAVSSTKHRGESLVLPNLRLKVLIEGIRMVLEIIYDDRFATFSYGGRVNMGQHTAVRYLKNLVENPSWWFNVSFGHDKFDARHCNKLCSILEEKINDGDLIRLIKRLFKSGVVSVELGGCYLGGGFPQECGLISILINIYFMGFDKEIQALRLEMNRENPKFVITTNSGAFYKPLKIYAVRYLDEILVITSGTKMLTLDLKHRVVKYLEDNLELKIDRVKTAVHSAVSEKMVFLGMEIQTVTPSVLHPPISEKAIRARKKYLRQKEVRLLELRSAKERNRKNLRLKIMSHVFKKLRRSNGFKFDFQIEHEVGEIFKSWADEVVQEFLGSLEECWIWHRQLSAEQVDKHLKPVKARKALEEEERKAEEEHKQRYAERTVDDLTKLCIKVDAPIELVRKAVKMAGFTNHMGRPRPIKPLMALDDTDIIRWYVGVGRRWLDFFCCCHNFRSVKIVVSYHLRFSCILTLAEKHDSTKREAIKHYTKDLKVFYVDGTEEVHFPTEREIKMMGDKNLADPKPVDGALTMTLIRLASDESSYRCVGHFCDRTDTIIYRVH
ncbi:hypothetical protein RJ639_038327 [Escallonia herrerae]|uniref:Domain X domain-containing protein n=1 Tax=Escallonia herrerae TaxID=1293975 RepID=A0AA88WKR8_9ASTE|nr:hypothetical protein RJ639_038327 [Escallonia herrerae]